MKIIKQNHMTKSAVVYPVQYARNNLAFRHNIDSYIVIFCLWGKPAVFCSRMNHWVMIQWPCFQYLMQFYYIFQSHERTIEWLLWKRSRFVWLNQCFWPSWLKPLHDHLGLLGSLMLFSHKIFPCKRDLWRIFNTQTHVMNGDLHDAFSWIPYPSAQLLTK